MSVTHKKCSRCERLLPLEAFAIDNQTKTGRQSMCKECRKLYDQMRRDKLKASARERRKALPGTKKYCPRCKQDLPLTSFNHNYKNKDGYSFYCRNCLREYNRDYYMQKVMQERPVGRPPKEKSD